jgi:aspartyl-tRNA synthetase
LTDWAATTEVEFLLNALANGGKVRALNAKGAAAKYSRKGLDELTAFVKQYGAKGLAWAKVEATSLNSSIKTLSPEAQQALRERMAAEVGDLILIVADTEDVVCAALGALRSQLGAALQLYRNWWEEKAEYDRAEEERAKKEKRPPRPFQICPEHFRLAWIIDFPSFLFDTEEGRWVANHHPFTAPRDEDLPLLEQDPGKVLAKAYDLVMNGYEVAGGSIRIHNPEVQSRVFGVLGIDEESAHQRFGFLLDALGYGAPPHGGIAFGLDRWTMILSGTTNIRDVLAFPKNQRARDLMTGAPAPVDEHQLRELGLLQDVNGEEEEAGAD